MFQMFVSCVAQSSHAFLVMTSMGIHLPSRKQHFLMVPICLCCGCNSQVVCYRLIWLSIMCLFSPAVSSVFVVSKWYSLVMAILCRRQHFTRRHWIFDDCIVLPEWTGIQPNMISITTRDLALMEGVLSLRGENY